VLLRTRRQRLPRGPLVDGHLRHGLGASNRRPGARPAGRRGHRFGGASPWPWRSDGLTSFARSCPSTPGRATPGRKRGNRGLALERMAGAPLETHRQEMTAWPRSALPQPHDPPHLVDEVTSAMASMPRERPWLAGRRRPRSSPTPPHLGKTPSELPPTGSSGTRSLRALPPPDRARPDLLHDGRSPTVATPSARAGHEPFRPLRPWRRVDARRSPPAQAISREPPDSAAPGDRSPRSGASPPPSGPGSSGPRRPGRRSRSRCSPPPPPP